MSDNKLQVLTNGLLGLVVVERHEPVRIWRNVGSGSTAEPRAMGNWLAIELAQDGPNVNAIGAWIEVESEGETTLREQTIGGGHASGQLGPTRFGLGDASEARVRVTWPDGERSDWLPVGVDHLRVRIERDSQEGIRLVSTAG